MATRLMVDAFRMTRAIRDAIIAHACAGFPEEVCGIIAGKDGAAVMLHPGRNVSLTPRTTFELDIETLTKQIEFEDAGLKLAAIYHSHPAGPETPSPTDVRRAAYPDAVYLIVSLADRARPVLRGFRIVEDEVSEVALSES